MKAPAAAISAPPLQPRRTAPMPADLRAALIEAWADVFAAVLLAESNASVGSPGGQNR